MRAMASPHASSFICLPFSDHPDIVSAYTVYFSVCTGSAIIGVVGAALFLAQVLRLGKDPYLGGAPSSQRCILVLLAVSDVCADLGVCECVFLMDLCLALVRAKFANATSFLYATYATSLCF